MIEDPVVATQGACERIVPSRITKGDTVPSAVSRTLRLIDDLLIKNRKDHESARYKSHTMRVWVNSEFDLLNAIRTSLTEPEPELVQSSGIDVCSD
jgi:hypothetical protein